LIKLVRYEEQSPKKLDWIRKTVIQEYKEAGDQPDYRYFLERKLKTYLNNSRMPHINLQQVEEFE
jgi:hypothetical protein